MLAEDDYDSVSMSRFAKAAGISVGAFYGRFETKHAFLLFLIRETFLQMTRRAEKALELLAEQKMSPEKSSQTIAENIASQFLDSENAGIIRATIKLGFSEPRAREYFEEYRKNIAERAAEILAPGGKRGRQEAARVPVQCLFGLLTDHIVYSRSNFLLAETRIKQGFSGLITGYILNKLGNKTKSDPDNNPRIKNKRSDKSSNKRIGNKPDKAIKSPKEIFVASENKPDMPRPNKRKPRLL